MDLYEEYQKIDDDCIPEDHCKWILRLEIDKSYLINNGITTHDIYFTLKDAYDDTINCIFSDDNADVTSSK